MDMTWMSVDVCPGHAFSLPVPLALEALMDMTVRVDNHNLEMAVPCIPWGEPGHDWATVYCIGKEGWTHQALMPGVLIRAFEKSRRFVRGEGGRVEYHYAA